MEFFCTICQKRHKVSDISADIWKIIAEDVKKGVIDKLKEITKDRPDKDDFSFLYMAVMKHLEELSKEDSFRLKFAASGNESAKNNVYFGLSQTREQKEASTPLLKALSYTVTLGSVIDEVIKSLNKSETGSSDLQRIKEIGDKIAENRSYVICTKEFLFYYKTAGKEDCVLDKVTDSENGSFDGLGYERICPHCGRKLSRAAGFAEEIIIGLLGSPRAGKTSCLVSLFSALLSNKYVKDNRPCFSCLKIENDENYNLLLEEELWYRKGYKVRKTDTIGDKNEVFSYSLIANICGRLRVLTFVDIPGEFWQSGGQGIDESFYTLYAGIYENIDCIWFMMSKTTLTYLAMDTDGKETLLAETSEDRQIVEGAQPMNFQANLMHLRSHLNSHGKKFPPMAVIITKPDAALSDGAEKKEITERRLAKLTPSGLFESSQAEVNRLLFAENRKQIVVDDKEIFNISRDVRKYLAFKSPAMYNAIINNCEYTFFVSQSSYGHRAEERPEKTQAKEASEKEPPRPYREMLPLIWTMAICGVVDVRHYMIWLPRNIFGSVQIDKKTEGYESFRFHFRENVPKKDEDKKLVLDDIKANLMRRNKDYKQTQLNHAKKG